MSPRTGGLALLLALLLSGCGFHLQGTAKLPAGLHKVYVAATDELSPFAVELDRALKDSGAEIAGSAAEADAIIRVAQDRTGRRVLSVSSRNTPQEYQAYYSLQYSIDRGGKQAVPQQEIELTRSYSFSESDALAKDREEAILREAMARDLADLVLRRLESL
jgi:LPS-assembly lipoprotein